MTRPRRHTFRTVTAGVRRRWDRTVMAGSELVRFLARRGGAGLTRRFEEGFAVPDPEPDTTPDHVALVERIVRSYRAQKRGQRSVPPPYQVGPLWEGMLERNFGELREAVESGDLERVGRLLNRLHRCRCSRWAGGSYEDLEAARASRFYRYQFLNAWRRYERVYRELAGREAPLEYSQVGGPVGLACGDQVIPLEALRYHYWAVVFSGLLEGSDHPVICEVGGGLGGQAYKVISTWKGSLTYLIFDIPEMLMLSSYFLIRSLPDRSVALFGENGRGIQLSGGADVVLMPNFLLPALPESSIDLFFNMCSFSELRRDTVLEYVRQIERCCRGWFLHVNHTARFQWNVEGERITNLPADELVVDPASFELVWRRKRPFERAEDRLFLRRQGAEHLAFLYRRKRVEAPVNGAF